ncbi:hypothetical protein Hamer_G000927 [Homarus americanus]|uniref:Uncharacterized protein n=1 Tax=Homarus americanus TaxID=6706 RepID=A0A8J5N2K4_HOMAM|nr:hypothetical protein Hamer_G000927 [Homarus americanus]
MWRGIRRRPHCRFYHSSRRRSVAVLEFSTAVSAVSGMAVTFCSGNYSDVRGGRLIQILHRRTTTSRSTRRPNHRLNTHTINAILPPYAHHPHLQRTTPTIDATPPPSTHHPHHQRTTPTIDATPFHRRTTLRHRRNTPTIDTPPPLSTHHPHHRRTTPPSTHHPHHRCNPPPSTHHPHHRHTTPTIDA